MRILIKDVERGIQLQFNNDIAYDLLRTTLLLQHFQNVPNDTTIPIITDFIKAHIGSQQIQQGFVQKINEMKQGKCAIRCLVLSYVIQKYEKGKDVKIDKKKIIEKVQRFVFKHTATKDLVKLQDMEQVLDISL